MIDELRLNDGSVLGDQIKLITDVLSEVLIEQSGRSMFQLEETIRLLTKSYRESDNPSLAIGDLKKLIEGLSYKDQMVMVKVFSLFFRLVLVLEERHITRIVEDQRGGSSESSLLSAVQYAKNLGLKATDILSLLDLNTIRLVFSDHPTGGNFDSLESNIRAVYDYVQKLDDPSNDILARQKYHDAIKYHITLLWQSEMPSDKNINSFGRVRSLLYYFESSIVDSISSLLNEMSSAISYIYDEEKSPSGRIDYRVPSFITLGSFIGGELLRLSDPAETYDTIILQKQLCLRIYIKKIEGLISHLSNSTGVVGISKELIRGLEEDSKLQPDFAFVLSKQFRNQPYRMKLEYIRLKLQNTLIQLRVDNEEMLHIKMRAGETDGPIYPRSIDFLRDLRQIQNSLKKHRAKLVANGPLRDLINLVKIFGFHLTSIDFMDDGYRIDEVLKEVFTLAGIQNLELLTLSQKMQLFREELTSRRPIGILNFLDELTPRSFAFIESLLIIKEVIEKISPRAIGSFLINNCNDESEILGLLLICKELNLSLFSEQSFIDFVPRFADSYALRNAPRFFKSLFMDPNYMKHLHERGFIQEIYLDYTKFVKKLGFFKGHYMIYDLQRKLISLFSDFNIRPRFFLGRGSPISRGFRPAQLGLLSLPSGSLGNIKVEENGENISSLFSNPELTTLNLEQIANGLLIHAMNDKFILGSKNPSTPSVEYLEIFAKISERNSEVYQKLLYEPLLQDLFKHATPSDLIAELFGVSLDFCEFPNNIDDKVWIHSWNLSRNIFPMFYGVGTALNEYICENGDEILKEMFKNWPLFKSLIEFVQMVLMKIDFKLMEVYLTLCHMEKNPIVFQIQEEFELTKSTILRITEQEELMEKIPALRAAIRGRLPHLDSLGILQVSLLKRWRKERDPKYLKGLIHTVNSVIAGLKNTG